MTSESFLLLNHDYKPYFSNLMFCISSKFFSQECQVIRVNKPKAAQVKAMFINELPKPDKALITDMIENEERS